MSGNPIVGMLLRRGIRDPEVFLEDGDVDQMRRRAPTVAMRSDAHLMKGMVSTRDSIRARMDRLKHV